MIPCCICPAYRCYTKHGAIALEWLWNPVRMLCSNARTYLVQLLLVHVVVIVRLSRHRGMRTPHGIEGAHQAGDAPPLSKDWSKIWVHEGYHEIHGSTGTFPLLLMMNQLSFRRA